jgi:hypothetical protein
MASILKNLVLFFPPFQGTRDGEGRGRDRETDSEREQTFSMHFPVSLLCANVCPCLPFSPSLHPWIGRKIWREEKGNVCFITNSVQRRNEWTHTRLTDWLIPVKEERRQNAEFIERIERRQKRINWHQMKEERSPVNKVLLWKNYERKELCR